MKAIRKILVIVLLVVLAGIAAVLFVGTLAAVFVVKALSRVVSGMDKTWTWVRG